MKNTTYKEKFAVLKPWIPSILNTIKKDIKNDHLKNDLAFCKKYFSGKPIPKLTNEEIAEGYQRAFEESETVEALGEFISNRWLLKNSDIYNFFAEKLMKINPDFNEIEELSASDSEKLLKEGHEHFTPHDLFLFSVINSVAFPEDIFTSLRKQAEVSTKKKLDSEEVAENEKSVEKLVRNHEILLARMVDKYEKKLAGLEKKYHQDIEALKKQVSRLQKQMM